VARLNVNRFLGGKVLKLDYMQVFSRGFYVALGENNKGNRTRHTIANERLEVALLRLEKAMAKNSEAENPVDPEKVATLVLENHKLKDTNKAIEDRLNGAIKNLRNILKEA
jgi:hypothetical protein